MATSLNPTTFIPTLTSTASEWILWHKALKSNYGKATANMLWIEAWDSRKSSRANTVELRGYLEDQGITIDEGVLDYVADWWDEGLSLMTMISKAGFYGGAALIILVGVPVFVFLLNVARRPELIGQTAGELSKLKSIVK